MQSPLEFQLHGRKNCRCSQNIKLNQDINPQHFANAVGIVSYSLQFVFHQLLFLHIKECFKRSYVTHPLDCNVYFCIMRIEQEEKKLIIFCGINQICARS